MVKSVLLKILFVLIVHQKIIFANGYKLENMEAISKGLGPEGQPLLIDTSQESWKLNPIVSTPSEVHKLEKERQLKEESRRIWNSIVRR